MTSVTHAPEHNRYEIHSADGELLGFADYRVRDGVAAFLHTEINPERQGHGYGNLLVRGALDDVRARGLGVRPFCRFVRDVIDDDPAYHDLVPAADRERFGIAA